MTPAQSRAARALLNWSQDQLAAASDVSVTSIRNFERGASEPMRNNLAAIQRALEEAGVTFIDEGAEDHEGRGVRLHKQKIVVGDPFAGSGTPLVVTDPPFPGAVSLRPKRRIKGITKGD